MKKRGGGKGKGGAFERHVCVALSLWLSGGKNKDLFWRSAMSGGRATVAGKRGDVLKRQCGDICATSPEGHALTDEYYIECKHYKKLDLDRFLLRRGSLYSFWRETQKQAARYTRIPLLIAKQNNTPTLVLSDHPLLTKLAEIKWDNLDVCCITTFESLTATQFRAKRVRVRKSQT